VTFHVDSIALASEHFNVTAPRKERHRIDSIGWLRGVGLESERRHCFDIGLVLGLAASHAAHSSVLIAAVAGPMSMATEEYVPVQSQADTKQALLDQGQTGINADDTGEHEELTAIYIDRGVDPALAKQVAKQSLAHDALGAHARDELGIAKTLSARPLQAALASGCSFVMGSVLPLVVVPLASTSNV
jgi:VIT1/CCC1 family predicted Fe2+/Mn2+ transporter